MLKKLFKKSDSSSIDIAPPVTKAVDHALIEAQEAARLADKTEWEGKLQAATGDDNALLAVARDAPLVDIKHGAVLALQSEAALKIAEREFRTHDRRVHRTAKQRYEALVGQREAREQANKLIESATALATETIIPANRLVELDHAWRALDASLLQDAQTSDFSRALDRLTGLIRERGDQQRTMRRWIADAGQVLAQLNACHAEMVTGSRPANELAAAINSAGKAIPPLLSNAPELKSPALPENGQAAALIESLQAALHQAGQIETRLALLHELSLGNQPGEAPVSGAETNSAEAAPILSPSQRWRTLSPIADARIDKVLNARFDEWMRGKDDARKAQQAEKKQHAKEQSKAAQQAHKETVAGLLKTAEASLTAGQLAETGKHLVAIKDALDKGAVDNALHGRINALQAEYARLRGWQHWGGGRVRDDLMQEAEELAKVAASADEAGAPKLPIKQHADAIEQLRVRWKELDRLGAATSRELWQRFDEALKTAYQPVAAHLDKLSAARKENMGARKALLATLDALKLADAEKGETTDWREVARALAHFQTEWRKLGPLEHTVPHRERDALLEQMNASVARLENPLQQVRTEAQAARQEFIARAKALISDPQGRDVVNKVRALQTEWQQHAKTHPLERKVENTLWTEFKASIDEIFNQRDAVFKAKDAELKANQTARETLIARLEALNQDTAPADIKRTVAEIEAEWRNAGEAPRSETARLEAQYRTSREAALKHVTASEQRIWNATFDSLLAKLSLCEEIEENALDVIPLADVELRWEALPKLPASWEQPLSARYHAAVENKPDAQGVGVKANESFDSILMQLESALDIPSPPAFQAARQLIKLQAMKSVLEGGRTTSVSKSDIERMTVAVLGTPHPDGVQRQRLRAIITSLRAGR